jgi:gas vesicle protein
MAEENGSSALLGFLLGVAVGGTLALLLAPQSGKKTRELLKKGLDDAEDKAVELARQAREKLDHGLEMGREVAGKARQRVENALHHGKEAVHQEIEELERRKEQIAQAIEAGRKAMENARKEV